MTADDPVIGTLDVVSSRGTVEGWAWDRSSRAPCHIQIRLDQTVVAEDIADRYRPDLLRAGMGYGHCAFYAHIRALAPGAYPLRLFDGRTGKPIGSADQVLYDVPAIQLRPPKSVEELLTPRDQWRDVDLLADPACLQLDWNYEVLGPERFVDRVFYFGLGRWADPSGSRNYTGLLARGEMTPTDVLRTILQSEERKLRPSLLPAPLDPDFPFVCKPSWEAGSAGADGS